MSTTKEPHHQDHDFVKVTKHTEYSPGRPPPHDLVTVTKHTVYTRGHPPPPPPHDVVRVSKHIEYAPAPHPNDVVRVSEHTEYSSRHPDLPLGPHDVVRVSERTDYPHGFHVLNPPVEHTEASGFDCLLAFVNAAGGGIKFFSVVMAFPCHESQHHCFSKNWQGQDSPNRELLILSRKGPLRSQT